MRTAYDIGREYAEWIQANQPDEAHAVDIDEIIDGTADIPNEDYRSMRAEGIEPDARQYWLGFNSLFE